MDIEEYIKLDSPTTSTNNENVEVPTLTPKVKRKYNRQSKGCRASTKSNQPTKDVMIVPDHELTRKRDILASIALLDGLKNYVGENISVSQIRNMEKEKLETYFTLYQEKAGQETTNEMMSSLVEMSIYGLSFLVNINNEEDLKNDLINNKQLRRTIGKQAAEITEKYGDAVGILRVLLSVGKHISFREKEEILPDSVAPVNTKSDSVNTC